MTTQNNTMRIRFHQNWRASLKRWMGIPPGVDHVLWDEIFSCTVTFTQNLTENINNKIRLHNLAEDMLLPIPQEWNNENLRKRNLVKIPNNFKQMLKSMELRDMRDRRRLRPDVLISKYCEARGIEEFSMVELLRDMTTKEEGDKREIRRRNKWKKA